MRGRPIDPIIRDAGCRVDGEMYADEYHGLASTRVHELTPAGDGFAARTMTIRYNWLRALGCILLMVASMLALTVTATNDRPAVAAESVQYGDNELAVAAVQQYLANHGYTIEVDGIFGQQTLKAVQHYQRSNGLLADGIVGPITQDRMGLSFEGGSFVIQPRPVSHVGTNLRCPQWAGLLEANGLPVVWFDMVIYRESRCDPNAFNGRGLDESYSLTQINARGALWGELQRRCGLTDKRQLFDPATNIACAAQLYRAYGRSPWGG